ncbi:uncharacterized protein [Rutidosis leptorrhynchoides]|uniref:uncharacterized protein n=1 Tax=Rutidosis leptorrhynchoides TaxID=125765 RepID=UPI003A98F285
MEGLHLAFLRALEVGLSHGIKAGETSLQISHFFYAYDVIILSEGPRQELHLILTILDIFYLVSCLKINVSKSHVFGIGVENTEVDSFALEAGCQVGISPTKYLGIPIGMNMKRVSSWILLIDTLRLSSWKANLLSLGGRLMLIESVMGSLGIYLMSVFRCPKTALIQLESLRLRFFWGGSNLVKKMAWIKWDNVYHLMGTGVLILGALKHLIWLYYLCGVGILE